MVTNDETWAPYMMQKQKKTAKNLCENDHILPDRNEKRMLQLEVNTVLIVFWYQRHNIYELVPQKGQLNNSPSRFGRFIAKYSLENYEFLA
jgi:hypothetical protein